MYSPSQLIKQYEEIIIISHVRPDGDAIGSLAALQLGLEQLGKKVIPVLKDSPPEIFSFLPHGKTPIQNEFPKGDNRLVIIVDLNDLIRTGFLETIQKFSENNPLIVIDHHPKGDLFRIAKAIIHKESASSAAEIVYSLLIDLGVKITPSIATSLLTGIYTDTGGFQYPNTTTQTLELGAELMRRGARLDTITRQIFHTKTVAGLKLLGLALERLHLTHDEQCAVSFITHEDIRACNASPEDIGGIIGELNVLPQVKFSLFLTEIKSGTIQGSLRTGEGHRVKVNQLAKLCEGGGHPRAAGFTIPGHIDHNKVTGKWSIVP